MLAKYALFAYAWYFNSFHVSCDLSNHAMSIDHFFLLTFAEAIGQNSRGSIWRNEEWIIIIPARSMIFYQVSRIKISGWHSFPARSVLGHRLICLSLYVAGGLIVAIIICTCCCTLFVRNKCARIVNKLTGRRKKESVWGSCIILRHDSFSARFQDSIEKASDQSAKYV